VFKYFTLDEFACKCCGRSEMNIDFVLKLDKARMISGVPYKVNSGYRCPKHNENFKNPKTGKPSNNHPSGHSSDVKAENGPTRGKILKGLYKAGFTRIGIRKDFIHVDDMSDKSESCWLY